MRINSILTISATAGLMLVVAACSSGSSRNNDSETTYTEQFDNNPSSLADNSQYRVVNNHIYPVNGRPAVVDFYADWCPPCRKLHPIFSALAKEFDGRVDFIRVDVDANEALASEYVGRGIPTLAFILPDGKVSTITEGFMSEPELRSCIEELLEKSNDHNTQ